MVAPVIAAIMMRWMFNDQFGIVNAVLEGLGLEGQPWLVAALDRLRRHPADRHLAVDAVVHPAAAGRPAEPAARSRSRPRRSTAPRPGACSRHLTLPMLRPVIVVCVVIRAIDAFRTFDIVWTLTGGGPGRSTELFSLYAYVLAFLNLDFGRGSAAAIIGGLIILVVGVGAVPRRRPHRRRPERWRWSAHPCCSAACRPAARRALFALALFAHLLRFRLSRAVADPDLAAAGIGRLLRPSRHRVHPGELRRGAAATSGWSRPSSIRR